MNDSIFQSCSRNGSFGTEQGLLRLLCTQPHRKYQSHVHNSLLRTHQFVLVPKLPLLGCRVKQREKSKLIFLSGTYHGSKVPK